MHDPFFLHTAGALKLVRQDGDTLHAWNLYYEKKIMQYTFKNILKK